MIDMNKEIVFTEGWTLDGLPFDDTLKARALDVIMLGGEYGLVLDQIYIESDMVCFQWSGRKGAMLAWYNNQSRRFSSESDESRNRALETIRNK